MMTVIRPTLFYERGRIMLNQINELIDIGYGQRRIAQTLNISRDQVRTILKKNNITTNNKVVDTTTDPERFATLFNQQYIGKFVYIGGYENNNSIVHIKCESCGDVFKRNAASLRKKANIQCDKCYMAEINAIRQHKKEVKRLQKEELKRFKKLNKPIKIKPQKTLTKHICKECHIEFESSSRTLFCSDGCYIRYYNATKKNLKRKMILRNGKVEDITLTSLIKRDDNTCHICGKKCNRKDFVITEQGHFKSGRSYPSIDHVIPVSKGGTHTWDNVKLAHMECNYIKSDNSMFEMDNGVIRMSI